MMVKVIKIMPKLESWCNKNPAIKQKKKEVLKYTKNVAISPHFWLLLPSML